MDKIVLFFFIISLGLLSASMILTAMNIGSKDTNNDLRKVMTAIMIMNGLGVAVLTIACFIYLTRNPTYSYQFLMIGMGVAIFLSLTSLSAAVLDRVY
jgi:hypothetical protein